MPETRDSEPRSYRIVFTEPMLREAVRSFVWRRGVVAQKGLWSVAAAMLAFLAWLVWRGDRSWLVGLVGAVTLFAPLGLVTVWIAHHRATLGRFRRMREPVATVTFQPDGLGLASTLGSGHVAWNGLTEIWERPDFWMLFTGTAQFMTLPVEGIPAIELERLRAETSRAGPSRGFPTPTDSAAM